MTQIAVLELTFHPESLDAAWEVMTRVLKETREFPGCERVDTVIDDTVPNVWRFIETWASAEHDAEYRKFRAGPGAISDLGPLLAKAPVLSVGRYDSSI